MARMAAIMQQIRDMLTSADEFDKQTMDVAGTRLLYRPLEQLVVILFKATDYNMKRLALSNIMRHAIAVTQEDMYSPVYDFLWRRVEVFDDFLPVPEAHDERVVAAFKEALSAIVPIGRKWCRVLDNAWTFPTAAELQQAQERGSLSAHRVDVVRAADSAVRFAFAREHLRTEELLRKIEQLVGEGEAEEAQQGNDDLT